jgi:GR25 family glycosyltransferase involved in LPS biosynthesis
MNKLIKTYCINLPESVDRKSHMESCFKNNNISNVIYSKTHDKSSQEVIKNFKKYNRIYCRGEFKEAKSYSKKEEIKNPIKAGELGLLFSYYEILKDIVKNNYQWSLICEDDVIFLPWFRFGYTQLIDIINKSSITDPTIIYLGSLTMQKMGRYDDAEKERLINEYEKQKFKLELNKTDGESGGTWCQLINLNLAKDLLEKYLPPNYPPVCAIDDLFLYLLTNKKINGYTTNPLLVIENSIDNWDHSEIKYLMKYKKENTFSRTI